MAGLALETYGIGLSLKGPALGLDLEDRGLDLCLVLKILALSTSLVVTSVKVIPANN